MPRRPDQGLLARTAGCSGRGVRIAAQRWPLPSTDDHSHAPGQRKSDLPHTPPVTPPHPTRHSATSTNSATPTHLADDLWGDVRHELEALPLQDWAGDTSDGVASHPAIRASALKLLSALPPHCSDLILWVCDLMVAVTAREATNRMSLSAVATVFAPGLVPSPASCTNPLEMLAWTDRGVRLTSLLLRLHMHKPLTTTSTSTAFGDLMDPAKDKGMTEGGRVEPDAADAQQQQQHKAGPPAAATVAQASGMRRRHSVARGEDFAAQDARVAAQGAMYTVTTSTGGGSPSHSRTVRRKRHSVEDQRAGLEALLTEIELHPPPESDSAVAVDVAERCSFSSDV